MKRLLWLLLFAPILALAQPTPAGGPPAASQEEVDAGTVPNKYVSPLTLANWPGGGGGGSTSWGSTVGVTDVASATTTDLGAATTAAIRITGTTTITGFGTVAAGTLRTVYFAGALTLTYNATSLILPGVTTITTVAGDSLIAESLGSGNWKVPGYWRQDGSRLTVAPITISASDVAWVNGSTYTKTLGANTTFTFSGSSSGDTITVALTNTASNYTVTWPTVVWPGGVAPVQTVGAKTDIYSFKKVGSTIYGSVIQNFF